MSKRYQGNVITDSPVTPSAGYSTASASGVWSITEAREFADQGNWPTPGVSAPIEYLVVAGGAGGGGGYYGAGGGAGGLLTASNITPTGSITVTVGGGGGGGSSFGSAQKGTNGTNSTLTGGLSVTSTGG